MDPDILKRYQLLPQIYVSDPEYEELYAEYQSLASSNDDDDTSGLQTPWWQDWWFLCCCCFGVEERDLLSVNG